MGIKLQRRSVYVGTVIVLIAAVAGFAVAAVSGITITTTSGNQNYGTVSPGNTIYATGTVTASLVLSSTAPSAGCETTAQYGSTTLNVVVAGAASACTETGEWYDVLTFSGVDVTSGASDTFYIGINGGPVGAGIVITTSGAFSMSTLNLYIDDGPTTGSPLITSLSVTVQGT